jgi:hypothetical protein
MRRLIGLLLVTLTAAFASTAGTAKAGLITGLLGGGCGVTAPVFAPWGDFDWYYLAPNGGFESGSANWTLSGGAQVVTQDNEPWYLAGFGSHALQIPTGGSASVNVCFGTLYPSTRFFVSGVNGNATVHVRAISRSLLGVLSVLDGGTFTAQNGWAPSPKIWNLGSSVASLVGSKTLTLQFTVENGTAQIDDLFVDPYLTRS